MLLDSLGLTNQQLAEGSTACYNRETLEWGVVLTAKLPPQNDLAELLLRAWKRELRFWWSAWTDGLKVLEPRSWWRSLDKFHVWCVSSSNTSLRQIYSQEARTEEHQQTLATLHARNLAHGELETNPFWRSEQGDEISPPLGQFTLEISLWERQNEDERFFRSESEFEIEQERPVIDKAGAEIIQTLAAEELAEYSAVYSCRVESESQLGDFPKDCASIRLDRLLPHPEYGKLSRLTAKEFYSSILRDSEGEELNLILGPVPDPFSTIGEEVVVVAEHPSDEDCLVIKPVSSRRLKFREGWCHQKNLGTIRLAKRKRRTLELSVSKRHIKRWIGSNQSRNKRRLSLDNLANSILESDGIFCVQGPPGTGKTHLACEVACKLLERDESARILVCAKEHQALGIVREMLLNRYGPRISSHTLVSRRATDFTANREGTSSEWARKTVRTYSESQGDYWSRLLRLWDGQAPTSLANLHTETAQVVFATTTSSWITSDRRFASSSEPFDLVIVEEAGKCYPSELLPALANAKRALLIGDQNQLPPFQIEEVEEAISHLREQGGGASSSSEHQSNSRSETTEVDWDSVKKWLRPFARFQETSESFLLTDQYRMIPIISQMISKTFYSTNFVNKRTEEDCKPLFYHPVLGESRLAWVDVPFSGLFPRAREDIARSRFNRLELQIVSALVRRLRQTDGVSPSISILSPYNAQVDRLAGNYGMRPALPDESPLIPGIRFRSNVHTVDSFQGNEADLVILSLVRNNPFGGPYNAWGFVLNPERLNVMMSRARRHLIVVGCSQLVRMHSDHEAMKPLTAILEHFRLFGAIVDYRDLE